MVYYSLTEIPKEVVCVAQVTTSPALGGSITQFLNYCKVSSGK